MDGKLQDWNDNVEKKKFVLGIVSKPFWVSEASLKIESFLQNEYELLQNKDEQLLGYCYNLEEIFNREPRTCWKVTLLFS